MHPKVMKGGVCLKNVDLDFVGFNATLKRDNENVGGLQICVHGNHIVLDDNEVLAIKASTKEFAEKVDSIINPKRGHDEKKN